MKPMRPFRRAKSSVNIEDFVRIASESNVQALAGRGRGTRTGLTRTAPRTQSTIPHYDQRLMPALHTEPTPNPNSIKITTDAGPFIADGMVSITSPTDADAHPLGQLLFAVDGIANVLILPQFVTVSKTDAADWKEVMPRVKQILTAHLEDATS